MPSAEFPAIDRDKSPLLAADDDAELIADALRRSPHIRAADAEPGDTVRFTTTEGLSYKITLTSAAPLTDAPLDGPIPTEAAAAAILNHPAFVVALPDDELPKYPDLPAPLPEPLPVQGITIQTREGFFYYLAFELDVTSPRPRSGSTEEPPAPVANILRAVGQLRSRSDDNPDSVVFDATADLLEHIAGTWDQQDDPTRQRAVALALALVL
ncbi:hypothetical protein [Streptomyces brasiliscabiei]|uniref:hypothetical protein n=1 Tax=Streptomyces brasiliscabiei TaxID=2736302 RepID=UPI001C1014C3|nr:hypothetical protein [Streptomyces brasiliscabiei]